MKKIFFLIVTIAILSVSLREDNLAVYASSDKDKENESLLELIIDPVREVPDGEINPVPTPTPVNFASSKPGLCEATNLVCLTAIEDTRSWTKSAYSKEIEAAALKYELDPQLIYATIMTESEGNKYAFRYEPKIKDASLCLGQILISTARSLGFNGNPKELYKPSVCIDLIGKYHRKMLDRYGSLTPIQLAVAYNSGSPHKRPVRGHLTRFRMWLAEEA